jgi:DedD protein
MERALKERIVGAVVLVVVAVLVVPVFLDGPSNHTETHSEQVLLPGQTEQSRKQQTIVLERDRDQPVPATIGAQRSQPRSAEPEPKPTPAPTAAVTRNADPPPAAAEAPPQAQPAVEPAAKPELAPAAADVDPPDATPAAPDRSETGMWAVQLGSFSDQANAERLAADLRSQGYAAFLSRLQTSTNLLHRVRVGPQENRDSAERIASQLERNGHKGQVVPHP